MPEHAQSSLMPIVGYNNCFNSKTIITRKQAVMSTCRVQTHAGMQGPQLVQGYATVTVFSGRELAFTFATCRRNSVCRLSVCDVGAPYSGG